MPKDMTINNQTKILDLLEKFHLFQSSLSIYQKKENKYTSSMANIEFINNANRELVLRPENFATTFEFNSKRRVYVTNKDRTIKFISNIGTICSGRYLNIVIPDQIKQFNSRFNKRIYFEKDPIDITYSNSTSNNVRNHHKSQTGQLLSFSEAGAGIICGVHEAEKYFRNDQILFSMINNLPLRQRVSGNILYVKQLTSSYDCNEEHCSIGIKFDKKISLMDFFRHTGLRTQEYLAR